MATSHPPIVSHAPATCPRCFGSIQHRPREVVCGDCGLVVDDSPVDHGPDWGRADDDASTHERAAPGNPNREDRGLGSRIGSGSGDTTADLPHRQRQIHRHARKGSHQDRTRGYATSEIRRIGAAVPVPDHLADHGSRVFRRVQATRLSGVNVDTVAAACLLVACRLAHAGRTAADIAPHARCRERDIRQRLLWVCDRAEIDLPPPSVTARVRVVGGRLDGADDAVADACQRVEAMDGHARSRGAPSTLAAALLYQEGPWTQATVADVAGVTPQAVRGQRERLDDSA